LIRSYSKVLFRYYFDRKSYLDVDLEIIGSGVLDVVGDLVQPSGGRENDDAGRRTLVQLKIVIAERRTVESGSAVSAAFVVESGLDFHLVSSLAGADGDLEAASGAVLDDDRGRTVAEGRSVDAELGQNALFGEQKGSVQPKVYYY
jgi:hypothetical protein